MNGRFAPIADLRLESIVANGIISGINLILSGSRRTIDPQPAGLGAAAAGIEHRDRRVVGKQLG
jgi:hypothetical protein